MIISDSIRQLVQGVSICASSGIKTTQQSFCDHCENYYCGKIGEDSFRVISAGFVCFG